jgi:hypothetical protein
MKYFKFYRESNNFADILKDKNIKKYVDAVVTWKNYCIIGIPRHFVDDIASYIILKYGDDLRDSFTKDYSPIPNVDYTPIRR